MARNAADGPVSAPALQEWMIRSLALAAELRAIHARPEAKSSG